MGISHFQSRFNPLVLGLAQPAKTLLSEPLCELVFRPLRDSRPEHLHLSASQFVSCVGAHVEARVQYGVCATVLYPCRPNMSKQQPRQTTFERISLRSSSLPYNLILLGRVRNSAGHETLFCLRLRGFPCNTRGTNEYHEKTAQPIPHCKEPYVSSDRTARHPFSEATRGPASCGPCGFGQQFCPAGSVGCRAWVRILRPSTGAIRDNRKALGFLRKRCFILMKIECRLASNINQYFGRAY